MNVTIVCFGAMREFLPDGAIGNRAELTVGEGATVADAVDALGAPRRLVFSLLVDGAHGTLDQRLAADSEITLMPPFAGGMSVRWALPRTPARTSIRGRGGNRP